MHVGECVCVCVCVRVSACVRVCVNGLPWREELIQELEQQERKFTRLKRAKISSDDFEPLTIIGRGAFGEVRLVRDKSNGQIYAMKKLKKTEMVRRGQVDHVKAERNLLAEVHNESVVKLFYSFQDEDFLYLVMEYLPGRVGGTLKATVRVCTPHSRRGVAFF